MLALGDAEMMMTTMATMMAMTTMVVTTTMMTMTATVMARMMALRMTTTMTMRMALRMTMVMADTPHKGVMGVSGKGLPPRAPAAVTIVVMVMTTMPMTMAQETLMTSRMVVMVVAAGSQGGLRWPESGLMGRGREDGTH